MNEGFMSPNGWTILTATMLALLLFVIAGAGIRHDVVCQSAWAQIQPDTALMVEALPNCRPRQWNAP